MSKPHISVIIPAYNEEKLLPTTLQHLADQQTEYNYEVIVVNNNSTDNTVTVAKSFSNKIKNLRVITEKRKGRGAARAAGFAAAKGDILLSTDADTRVPSNWIQQVAERFEDPTIQAISGPCRIDDLNPVSNTIFNTIQPIGMRVFRMLTGYYWLSGFNFGIRREIYEQSGGFDPKLNAQEDVILGKKVMAVTPITMTPNIVVTFSGRRFENGLISGLWDYLTNFTAVVMMNKHQDELKDVR